MKKLHEQLDAAALRMDAVVLLAGMLNDGDAIAAPLRDLLVDEDDEALVQCFPDMPAALLADREDDSMFCESFCMWANDTGKFGFAVRFVRPVMKWNLAANSASFSWGYCYTAWLYGDTLAQVVQRGKQWSKAREKVEIDEAKATAKATAKAQVSRSV